MQVYQRSKAIERVGAVQFELFADSLCRGLPRVKLAWEDAAIFKREDVVVDSDARVLRVL